MKKNYNILSEQDIKELVAHMFGQDNNDIAVITIDDDLSARIADDKSKENKADDSNGSSGTKSTGSMDNNSSLARRLFLQD